MQAFEELELPPWEKFRRFGIFPTKHCIHVSITVLLTMIALIENDTFSIYSRSVWASTASIFFPPSYSDFQNDLSTPYQYYIFTQNQTVLDSNKLFQTYFSLPEISVNELDIYSCPGNCHLGAPYVRVNTVHGTHTYYVQNSTDNSWPLAIGNYDESDLKSFFKHLQSMDFIYHIKSYGVSNDKKYSDDLCYFWTLRFNYNLMSTGQILVTSDSEVDERCHKLPTDSYIYVCCALLFCFALWYQLLLIKAVSRQLVILNDLREGFIGELDMYGGHQPHRRNNHSHSQIHHHHYDDDDLDHPYIGDKGDENNEAKEAVDADGVPTVVKNTINIHSKSPLASRSNSTSPLRSPMRARNNTHSSGGHSSQEERDAQRSRSYSDGRRSNPSSPVPSYPRTKSPSRARSTASSSSSSSSSISSNINSRSRSASHSYSYNSSIVKHSVSYRQDALRLRSVSTHHHQYQHQHQHHAHGDRGGGQYSPKNVRANTSSGDVHQPHSSSSHSHDQGGNLVSIDSENSYSPKHSTHSVSSPGRAPRSRNASKSTHRYYDRYPHQYSNNHSGEKGRGYKQHQQKESKGFFGTIKGWFSNKKIDPEAKQSSFGRERDLSLRAAESHNSALNNSNNKSVSGTGHSAHTSALISAMSSQQGEGSTRLSSNMGSLSVTTTSATGGGSSVNNPLQSRRNETVSNDDNYRASTGRDSNGNGNGVGPLSSSMLMDTEDYLFEASGHEHYTNDDGGSASPSAVRRGRSRAHTSSSAGGGGGGGERIASSRDHQDHLSTATVVPFDLEALENDLAILREAFESLTWKDRFTILNMWFFVSTVGNIIALIVSGQITFSYTEIAASAYLKGGLGFACFMFWFSLVQYLEFFPRYYIMISMLKTTTPRVSQFLLGVLPIFVGYALLGMVCFGDKVDRFGDITQTLQTLFSVVNGDIVYDTFNDVDTVGFGGQVYVYIYVILFTYVVLMTVIAIVEEAFFEAQGKKSRAEADLNEEAADDDDDDDAGHHHHNHDHFHSNHNNDPNGGGGGDREREGEHFYPAEDNNDDDREYGDGVGSIVIPADDADMKEFLQQQQQQIQRRSGVGSFSSATAQQQQQQQLFRSGYSSGSSIALSTSAATRRPSGTMHSGSSSAARRPSSGLILIPGAVASGANQNVHSNSFSVNGGAVATSAGGTSLPSSMLNGSMSMGPGTPGGGVGIVGSGPAGSNNAGSVSSINGPPGTPGGGGGGGIGMNTSGSFSFSARPSSFSVQNNSSNISSSNNNNAIMSSNSSGITASGGAASDAGSSSSSGSSMTGGKRELPSHIRNLLQGTSAIQAAVAAAKAGTVTGAAAGGGEVTTTSSTSLLALSLAAAAAAATVEQEKQEQNRGQEQDIKEKATLLAGHSAIIDSAAFKADTDTEAIESFPKDLPLLKSAVAALAGAVASNGAEEGSTASNSSSSKGGLVGSSSSDLSAVKKMTPEEKEQLRCQLQAMLIELS